LNQLDFHPHFPYNKNAAEQSEADRETIRGAFTCRIQRKAGGGHGRISNYHDLYFGYDPLAEIDRSYSEPDQKVSTEKAAAYSQYAAASKHDRLQAAKLRDLLSLPLL